MNDLETSGNLIEAVLWFLVTAFLLAKALTAEGKLRRIFLLLATGFLFFALSDLIEAHTGAWWKPVWLLILKLACIGVFVFGFRRYYQITAQCRDKSALSRLAGTGNSE